MLWERLQRNYRPQKKFCVNGDVMEFILSFFQATGVDFHSMVNQLPVVAITLGVVWYFDSKGERKDERFYSLLKEMQEDWQGYLGKQAERNEQMLSGFAVVIEKHTDTLRESISAKTKLIELIEQDCHKR